MSTIDSTVASRRLASLLILVVIVAAACSTRAAEIAVTATATPSATTPNPSDTLGGVSANPLADTSVPEQPIRIVTSWNAAQRVMWDTRITLSEIRASDPQAAITPDGTVHVVWAQLDLEGAHTSSIMYRRLSPNGEWSRSETLRSNAGAPRLTADGMGQLHLIWGETQPGTCPYGCPSRVFHSMLPKDGRWSDPRELTNALHLTEAPEAMAAADDGALHIAWSEDPFLPHDSVWYAQRQPDGTWSPPEEVYRPAGSPGFVGGITSGPRPSMAVDDQGTVFRVWGDNASSSGTTYFAQRPAGGGWTKPRVLFQFQKGVSIPLMSPIGDGSLALLIQALWTEDQLFPRAQRGGSRSMFVLMFRSPEGAWSVPEAIPNMGGDASWPAVVADITGRLFTVWSYTPPSAIGAFSALRLPDPPGWSMANSLPVLPDELVFDKKLMMRGEGQLLLIAAAATHRSDAQQVVALAGCLFPERLPTPPTPGPAPTPTAVPTSGFTPAPRPTPTPIPTCLPMSTADS